MGCMYLFKLWFSPGICPGVAHMVALFLVFKGTSILFSIMIIPVNIPTNHVGEVPFRDGFLEEGTSNWDLNNKLVSLKERVHGLRDGYYFQMLIKPRVDIDISSMGEISLKTSFKKKKYLFWVHWVSVAAHGLSLAVVSGGCSSFQSMGFSLWWLLLLQSTGSRVLKLH